MKILYIHHYFKTPEEGGCIRSYYLAKGLVDNGYTVEMITAHNGKDYLQKEIAGIKVHYLPVFYDNHLKFFGRIYSFLKFAFLASKKAKNIAAVDICYAMSTPLTIGLITLYLKKKRSIPYYFEVGDLWPEAPIQMGIIKNFFYKELLYRLEKRIYQEADKLIALSPGIRDGIKKVTPSKQVAVIPNMSDCHFFRKEVKDAELELSFKVKNNFVITYFGAAGKANHLEYMLKAAESCRTQHMPVKFLVAAYGSELERIKKLCEDQLMDTVYFLPYQSKEGLRKVLNVTDAVYISFANKPVLQTGSPNKFFDGLAAGKITIMNTKGWIAELIASHECGFSYEPDHPEQMVQKLKLYLQDSALLLRQQKNARTIAEQFFSRELHVQKFLKVFENEHQTKIRGEQVYTLTA